jgi:ERCC4-type nuclease/predicted transcriptional regulator
MQQKHQPDDLSVLSIRAFNCLRHAGYTTAEQVMTASDDDLLTIKGMGHTTWTEIRRHFPYTPFNELVQPDDLSVLSLRASNILKRGGYLTGSQIRAASNHELMRLPNTGSTTLAEIRRHFPYTPSEQSGNGSPSGEACRIQISPDLLERLNGIAHAQGWTTEYLIDQVLRNYLRIEADYAEPDLEAVKAGILE